MNISRLILILGDQLDNRSPALEGLDPQADSCVMIEAHSEAEIVWSHKQRIALFLSAMRHFAAELQERGVPLLYRKLEPGNRSSLTKQLEEILTIRRPQEIVCAHPAPGLYARKS